MAGHVDPVFVDDVAELAQAVIEQAHDGDVVIVMGAGSIGAVPAQLVERLERGSVPHDAPRVRRQEGRSAADRRSRARQESRC